MMSVCTFVLCVCVCVRGEIKSERHSPHLFPLLEGQEGGQEIGQLWRVHALLTASEEGGGGRDTAHIDGDIS